MSYEYWNIIMKMIEWIHSPNDYWNWIMNLDVLKHGPWLRKWFDESYD
jgi:hypothetical protein